jgi:alpha-L-fucosidase
MHRKVVAGMLLIALAQTSVAPAVNPSPILLAAGKASNAVKKPKGDDLANRPAGATDPNDPKLAWYRQAKFGLFIHWGLYAIPAGTWQGTQIPGIGEWIMNRAKIPVIEYERLAKQFNPVKFDADQWVQLAQDAGMKYITITSKHHDGFAMFGSKVSKYNIVDATPFHRDPMKELAQACAKRGIRLCFYYSQAQDWHEPGGMGNTWDFGPDKEKAANGAYDKYLEEKALPQVRELLTQYGPLGLIWFDTPREMTPERAAKFLNLVKELQPACLVNGRLGGAGDYRSMGDNRIPQTVVPGVWETPATLNDTWGYKSYDDHWKTPADVTFKLVDIVSKGGNYLLNVGPTAEGVIPAESQKCLRAVGQYLKANGEAVYGCDPTPLGDELKQNAWRCTTKPGKLYIHFFDWPAGKFELSGVKSKITAAFLLTERDKRLSVAQEGDRVTVQLPPQKPGPVAAVLCLEHD